MYLSHITRVLIANITRYVLFLTTLNFEVMKVYLVTEDCKNDETRVVACFGTLTEAEDFCEKYNTDPYFKRFYLEEWEVGEILEGLEL